MRGEHSALLRAGVARRMHRRIRGSVFKEIPNAYHHVPLDNPDATVGAIGEFIASI